MLNPNIDKYVIVNVLPIDRSKTYTQYAVYKGVEIRINDYADKPVGKRRMHLRYSIVGNCYYLASK